MTSGRLFYPSVLALGLACVACFVAASLEWGDHEHMLGIDSAEAAEQARFAVELYAIGALSLLASIAFLIRRSGWGWWVALGIQAGSFGWAVVEGTRADIGWYYLSIIPLITLVLLIAFRQARATAQRPLDATG
ncbi:MAG TPA: hypothetical protein VGX22_12730 [Candidatus Dormibacteraeota bacterium]|nr:hypothetical protein [Candidatus Dormibacteraeota bacterium]